MKNRISKKGEILELIIAIFFLLIGVIFRFLPHPPNFTPVTALALFSGVYLSRKISLLLPILIMVVSDLFIGFYSLKLMTTVYLSFLICVILGFRLKKNKKWYTVIGYSFLGSVIFYLATNFAVWAFTGWYPKNLSGLTQCYIMALPFFKNSLAGNLFYTSLLFAAYQRVKIWIRKRYRISDPILINKI